MPASLQPGSGSVDFFVAANWTYTGVFNVKRLVADEDFHALIRSQGTQATRLGSDYQYDFALEIRRRNTSSLQVLHSEVGQSGTNLACRNYRLLRRRRTHGLLSTSKESDDRAVACVHSFNWLVLKFRAVSSLLCRSTFQHLTRKLSNTEVSLQGSLHEARACGTWFPLSVLG